METGTSWRGFFAGFLVVVGFLVGTAGSAMVVGSLATNEALLAQVINSNPQATLVPVYRLYNSTSGHHFYTTSYSEALGAPGFKIEGVIGYIYSTQVSGTLALFRMYQKATGDHYYTADIAKYSNALKNGYILEGTMGYINTAQAAGTSPLYNVYYRISSGGYDSFYTTYLQERNSVIAKGGLDQGITGYVLLTNVAPTPSTVSISSDPATFAAQNWRFTTVYNQNVTMVNTVLVKNTGQNSTISSITASVSSYGTLPLTVSLYDDNGILVASKPYANPVNFNNIQIALAQGQTKKLAFAVTVPASGTNNSSIAIGATTTGVYQKADGTAGTFSGSGLTTHYQHFFTAAPQFKFVSASAQAASLGTSGATTAVSGSFVFTVGPYGASMSAFASNGSDFVISTSTTGVQPSGIAKTVTVTPNDSPYADGGGYTVTLSFIVPNSGFGTGGVYTFYVKSIAWNVGGYSLTQTYGLDNFQTNAVTVVKGDTTIGGSNITLSSDPRSPRSQNWRVNSYTGLTGVTVGTVNVKSDTGASMITDVSTLVVASGTKPSTLYLYDGSILVDSKAVPTSGTGTVSFHNLTINVALDQTKTLTFKADMPSNTIQSTSISAGASTTITYQKPNGSSATVLSTGLAVYSQYFFSAAPQFTFVSATAQATSLGNAASTTNINGQFTFTVKPNGSSMAAFAPNGSDFVISTSTTGVQLPGMSKSVTVIPNDDPYADGGLYTVTVGFVIPNSGFTVRPGSGNLFKFYIQQIQWTMNGLVVTQRYGLQDFVTNLVSFTK